MGIGVNALRNSMGKAVKKPSLSERSEFEGFER
ncbi:MAG: hypothetical protein ACJAVN_000604 [Roseivirga sp.]|jgi:hypothetical protein